ncbi:MAG TPA: peptide chain release factor N(5)-glutamine methyltransferase [Lachnospiraceae bacterium]
MTYQSLLAWGKEKLKESGIEEYDLDAWLLLSYCSGLDRGQFFLKALDSVKEEEESSYKAFIVKRQSHIPLQHITHQAFFMGLEFWVDKHVLIPRQDTECLVERVLEVIKEDDKVLDMCTGSGCIALSIKKLAPGVKVTGVDVSKQALLVAEKNSQKLGEKVTWVCSNLFDQIKDSYDIIVSNPPYIESKVIESLQEEVKEHDPRMALDGGEDGLYFYREIGKKALSYLKERGWLFLEIGYNQKESVSCILEENGFIKIHTYKDLAGFDRIVAGQKG